MCVAVIQNVRVVCKNLPMVWAGVFMGYIYHPAVAWTVAKLKLNSSTLQSQSSCWAHTSWGSMESWCLIWSDCTDLWRSLDVWLTHLSSVSLQLRGLEHGSSGWCMADCLKQIFFFFTMMWDVFWGSCWFFCKNVNSAAQLQKFFYFMVSDMICFLYMFHQRLSNLGFLTAM